MRRLQPEAAAERARCSLSISMRQAPLCNSALAICRLLGLLLASAQKPQGGESAQSHHPPQALASSWSRDIHGFHGSRTYAHPSAGIYHQRRRALLRQVSAPRSILAQHCLAMLPISSSSNESQQPYDSAHSTATADVPCNTESQAQYCETALQDQQHPSAAKTSCKKSKPSNNSGPKPGCGLDQFQLISRSLQQSRSSLGTDAKPVNPVRRNHRPIRSQQQSQNPANAKHS